MYKTKECLLAEKLSWNGLKFKKIVAVDSDLQLNPKEVTDCHRM
jgi:hypothetical protein